MPGPARLPKRTKLLAAALVLALAALALFWNDLSASYQTLRVKQALRSRDWEQAVAVLNRFPAKAKQSAQWHYLLARVERRRGNVVAADRSLVQAAELGGDNQAIARQRLLLKAQSKIHEAEGELQDTIAQGATDEEAEEIYEAMARGYLGALRFAEAARCLKYWSDWQPQNPLPHLWLGDLHQRTENPEVAAQEYAAALKCDATHFEARLKLAKVHLEQWQVPQAATLFEECLRQRTDSPEALLGLAECQRRQGETSSAKTLLHEALVLDLQSEEQATALTTLGQMAEEEGSYPQAVVLLGKSVELNPIDSSNRLALAAVLGHLGQTERASAERKASRAIVDRHMRLVSVTRRALLEPKNPDLRCQAGDILMEQGLLTAAAQWYQTAIDIDPNHRAAHEGLAAYYQTLGDVERAHAQQAIIESLPPETSGDERAQDG